MSDSSSQRNVVEVLAEEFVQRYRQGDRPPLTEYTRQYPDLADEIEDLFPAMLMMENLKPITEDAAAAQPLTAAPIESLGDYRQACQLVVYNSDTLQERFRYEGFADESRTLAISPDGSQIAVCGWTRIGSATRAVVILVDAISGKAVWQSVLFSEYAGSLRWSRDGSHIAVAGWQSLAILHADTGEPLTSVREIEAAQWIGSIDWHPGGERLALAGADGTVRIVDVSGREVHRLLDHTAEVTSVVWSPDGTRLASTGVDRTVRIWDPATGTQLLALRGPRANVCALAWSPDGMQLAAGDIGGELRIWDAFLGYAKAGAPMALARIRQRLIDDPDNVAALRLSAEIHRRTGNVEALQEDSGRLLEVLKRRVQENPASAPAAEELADALLAPRKKVTWKQLAPVTMQSTRGASLHALDDRSIVATGANAPGEVYTVRTASPAGQMAMIRLEVLPDASLPNGGPGRHASGNFQLAAVRLYRHKADSSPPEQLSFSSVTASYAYRGYDVNVVGLIDESLGKVWHVWGKFGQAHYADFMLERPCELSAGDTLTFQLAHRGGFAVNLGRFRLLARAGSDGQIKELLANAIEQGALTGVEKLAAAYLVIGNPQQALEVLVASDNETNLRTLLLAIANHGLGDQAEAQNLHRQWRDSLGNQMLAGSILPLMRGCLIEIENFTPEAASGHVDQLQSLAELSRLSAVLAENPESEAALSQRTTIYRQMGRWREASNDLVRLLDVTPGHRLRYTSAAACLLLAGDEEGYRALCRRMADQFHDTTLADVADSTCKVCLLLPGDVSLEDLPVETLETGYHDQTWRGYHPWFAASLALVAYRRGEYEQALDWASRLGMSAHPADAMAISIRAMSHHQLGDADQARSLLEALDRIVPADLRPLAAETHETSPASSPSGVNHDWQIAEIMRREAESLIESP